MTTTVQRASLLALDWGTSSLRAYVLDAQGKTLAERQEPWGLMQVANVTGCQGADAFNAAFEMILSDWPDLPTSVPVIAAGMVGSAQGWQEVPYLEVPCALEHLAANLVAVRATSGRTIWIVPGLREAGTLPNVMRGEETQIIGALAQLSAHTRATSSDTVKTLLGLPGSHSKWATLEGNKLVHFDTFMTGEAFSALGDHTILARTSSAALPATKDLNRTAEADGEENCEENERSSGSGTDAAFQRGVVTALSPSSKGLLATIFSCRTLALSGELSPIEQREYLSGLLIGAEIAGMREVLTGGATTRTDGEIDSGSASLNIALIGDPKLCKRYALALRLADVGTLTPLPVIEHASQQGLWQLARIAGLVSLANEHPF